jgi:hypothetical protein
LHGNLEKVSRAVAAPLWKEEKPAGQPHGRPARDACMRLDLMTNIPRANRYV